MARPSLYQHPKFTRLAIRLRSRALALGSLELVWQVGYASGNPYVGSPDEVEYVADWRGPSGELAAALLDCGFLDRREDGQLEIHDLHENAPDYVRSRARMEKYRAKARSGEVEHPNRSTPRNGYVTVTQRERNEAYPGYGSPTPTPTPTPVVEESSVVGTPPGGAGGARRKSGATKSAGDDLFARFWSAYPRKVAKPEALKAWGTLVNGDRESAVAGAIAWAEVWAGATEDRRQYLPHPATWLRARRWEDDPAEVRRAAHGNGRAQSNGRTSWSGALVGARPELTPEALERARRELEEDDE